MEVVIEFEEIERLVLEALKARGITLSGPAGGPAGEGEGVKMHVRQNHKENTIRLVFVFPAGNTREGRTKADKK